MLFKKIMFIFIVLMSSYNLFCEPRLYDILINQLNEVEVDNSNGTIIFYFKAEKATFLSAEKKANTENKQWRHSSTTGEDGYYLVEPILDLKQEQIEILEGDKNGNNFEYINQYESDMKLINSPKNFTMYSLLLLDVSGSITKSLGKGLKPVLDDLKKASIKYINSIGVNENKYFAVYAFDGREELVPVITFSNNKDEIIKKINEIDYSITKDISTNLYGAVYNSIDIINENLNNKRSESTQNIIVGTLTVFTDGTDRAGRLGANGLYKVMDKIEEIQKKKNFYIYTIGLGREIDRQVLTDIGYDRAEFAYSAGNIFNSFDNVAKIIEALSKTYYRVEYKTPSRKGSGIKTIIIQMKYKNHQGGYRTKFDPSNFEF